ncbi:putative lipid II flippase FtsW [Congregibacter litoralis]|uniref:Probable peptidoglycan glycosyltransferase FtsW n=1 Tax=Congregibacter litoralis KT71 TaxID=314285 RepID=A4A5F9_9GAMM|nr:putative lipid II flippase FtsW [Congregibacter litoralis]EAQ99030.1 cell division-specific peptidoglycan biosynthesis regulator FtsW [Congregibacter litoralis KT71]
MTAAAATTPRATVAADTGRFPDLMLMAIAVALLLIGLIAISSASVGYAEASYNNMWHHSIRHLIYLALALISGFICYQVPVEFWYRSGWLLLLLSSLLLILVLIPGVGRNVNGSQRWLALGSMTLQPSELAKAAMIVYLSGYLLRQGKTLQESWQGILRPLMILGLVAVLLLAEPDFGAVVIMFATAFGMLFLAGMRLTHLSLIILATGALGALLIQAAPYRLQRLIAYTDPWADPFGSGFQLIQSLIAFGRGEWFGVGLGNSVQKLFYLPEAHTDFVFSIWAEETGFVGAFVLISLFLALVLRIFYLGRQAQKDGQLFSAYLCFGVALMFSGQAFVNMGVSAGLLPTKGLTLPLISYGGTSLITACVLLSMVLRVAHERNQPKGGRKR